MFFNVFTFSQMKPSKNFVFGSHKEKNIVVLVPGKFKTLKKYIFLKEVNIFS